VDTHWSVHARIPPELGGVDASLNTAVCGGPEQGSVLSLPLYILTVPKGARVCKMVETSSRRAQATVVCAFPEAVWYPVPEHDVHTLLMFGGSVEECLIYGSPTIGVPLAPGKNSLYGGTPTSLP
jgi:hypothetical protein